MRVTDVISTVLGVEDKALLDIPLPGMNSYAGREHTRSLANHISR